MPAIPSVNRNGSTEKSISKRTNVRKTNTVTTANNPLGNGAKVISSNTSSKINGDIRKLEFRVTEICDLTNRGSMEPKPLKRSKRSLVLEKERCGPRSVKILRRAFLCADSVTESNKI